jgi:hypothetical protein
MSSLWVEAICGFSAHPIGGGAYHARLVVFGQFGIALTGLRDSQKFGAVVGLLFFGRIGDADF